MSLSAAGSSFSSRSLVPYQGPYLAPVEQKGTARILKIAKDNKWLESRGGSTLNPKPQLVLAPLAPLERAAAADIRLRTIMPYLDVKSLCRLTAASKALHGVKADAVEKRADAVSDLIRYLKGDLARSYPGDKEVLKTIQSLDLTGIPLNSEKIRTILGLCPNVKELDLSGCGLTHDCIQELQPLCRQLVSLKLHNNANLNMNIGDLVLFSNLKKVVLEDLSVLSSGALDIATYASRSVQIILKLGQLKLESFRLAAQNHFGRDISALIPLLKLCPSLKEFIIDRFYISDEQLLEISQFKNLEVLQLGWNVFCSNRVLQEIGKIMGLKKLEIGLYGGSRTQLEPLLGLTELQVLTLQGNQSFTKEELQKLIPVLRNLTELTLHGCDLKEKELLAILVECPQLKKLHLNKCANITGKHFHRLSVLPKLEAVTFVTCHQLKGSIFNSLAQCKTVTTLDLDDCKRIGFEEVAGVETFGFKRLVIDNCYYHMEIKRYEELVARCPQLQELVIRNNEVAADALLEKIIPHCKGVRKMKLEMDLGNNALRSLSQLPHLELLDYTDDDDGDFELITQETRQFLKNALPNLVILRDGKKEFPANHRAVVENSDGSGSDSDDSGSDVSGSDSDHDGFSDSEIDSSDSDNDTHSSLI